MSAREEFANLIKDARIREGERRGVRLTATMLAIEIGIAQSTMCRWESCMTFPRYKSCLVLAQALSIDSKQLWSVRAAAKVESSYMKRHKNVFPAAEPEKSRLASSQDMEVIHRILSDPRKRELLLMYVHLLARQ